ncbi:MAG: LytTR family DNA-binding domain-containing protein [Atopobiaceae bacterium]|jgi:DNA-binding LytR/AlgR family response regulator|nr:LytTR family DNA-binding domain-containing protein [Atopobiaceae bacterium]MCI2173830.1 LytTR family DNA-binding domain-containing protein [Atopobiaceae bacterium]MCI2208080.1 LytTR family DNA-binding domain-containing protein [Atopobiaceae bacterium]
MYRILIVEDDDEAASALEGSLMRYAEKNGEEFSCSRLTSAVTLAQDSQKSDLIFLDIDLPGISGLEAATLIRTYDQVTPIIFVTNLVQYAVRGYEVDALDFIVKPVTYYDLSLRMDKAMRAMRRNSGRSVVVPTRDGMRVIAVRDLAYVETSGHDVIYHEADGEPLRTRTSLRQVEEDLADEPFVRVSSGCLANMAHVRSVAGNALDMDTGDTLYFSRSRRKPGLERIAAFLGGSI